MRATLKSFTITELARWRYQVNEQATGAILVPLEIFRKFIDAAQRDAEADLKVAASPSKTGAER